MSFRYVVALALALGLAGDVSAQARRTVTGRVTDEQSGQPIPGAQIVIKGTNTGTLGRADGSFSLSVPATPVTLEVSFIGFSRAEVRVAPTQNAVQVALKVDVLKLDELVVTGQATTVKRRNLANAVGTVNAREISQVPAASISQALAGKMAGVNITESSGAPGGSSWVTLRGVTSINGAFTPLYVIDGVIASDVALPRATNFVSQASRGNTVARTGENAVNRIADLNPNDIENVEVLKGAAASAIYGSKASNGVIIITTKRGKAGRTMYSVTQRFGSAEVSKLMGLRRYATLEDAVARFGAPARDPVTGWKPGAFFDNEKAITSNPFNYETVASMSGGTEDTRYYASVSNKHEGGVVYRTFNDKRSFKLNLDQNAGSRVQIGLGADIFNNKGDKGLTINENNGSSYWSSIANTPSFFDMRPTCPDGSRTMGCEGGVFGTNPYFASQALHTASVFKNEEEVWRVIGSGRLNISAIEGEQHTLRLLGNAGADFFNQDNRVFSPPELQFEALDGLLGSYVASEARNLNYNLNANAVYQFKSGPNLQATTQLGVQYEGRDLRIERIAAANLIGGLETILAGTQHIPDARHELVKDIGFFVQQEMLTLDEKLLLTAGLRADKSSNNGDPDELFYYPKVSGSFRLPNLVSGVVDELKLRAAYGASGNQPLYGQKYTQLTGAIVGGLGAAQITGAAAAEDIVPERQREIEGGLDLTLFGARANVELTAYNKRITDLLLQRSLPTSYGFTGQFLNAGVLTTKGLELSLSGLPIQTQAITWNPRISFSRYRSTVDELPVPRFGGGGFSGGSVRIEEGKSATQIIGRDTTATGTIDNNSFLGEVRPDYTLQLSSDLRIMGVSLSFVVDRQKGSVVGCLTCWLWDSYGQSPDYDQPSPVPGMKLGAYRVAQFGRSAREYIQDASYVKLREVTLGFDMPRAVLDKVWASSRSARFTLSGRNLKTWTNYEGIDPESRWTPESGLASGLPSELWGYPPSRTLWAGLEIGF